MYSMFCDVLRGGIAGTVKKQWAYEFLLSIAFLAIISATGCGTCRFHEGIDVNLKKDWYIVQSCRSMAAHPEKRTPACEK